MKRETYQEDESSYKISEEHKEIIDKRLADHKKNPIAGKNREDLKSDLRTKYDA